jgi:hypothetical protein
VPRGVAAASPPVLVTVGDDGGTGVGVATGGGTGVGAGTASTVTVSVSAGVQTHTKFTAVTWQRTARPLSAAFSDSRLRGQGASRGAPFTVHSKS